MFIAAQFTIGKTWNQPQCPLTEEWISKMCICVVQCLVAQSCPTLCNPMDCSPPGSSVHGGSPGKTIGVGWHSLHQGIFPTQGLNPGLLHCRQILYQLSHQGIRGIQEGRGRESRPEHSDSATTKHLLFNSQGLLHGLLT